jgi:hypothetical protein
MREAIKATDEGGHQGVSSEALGRAAPSRAPSTPRRSKWRRLPTQSDVINHHQSSSVVISGHQSSSAVISRHQPSSRGVPSGGASPPNRLLHRPAHGRRVTSNGIRSTRCKGARDIGHARLEGGLGRLCVLFGAQAEDAGNQRSLVGHQRRSEAIRGDQRSLEGHQRQSPD